MDERLADCGGDYQHLALVRPSAEGIAPPRPRKEKTTSTKDIGDHAYWHAQYQGTVGVPTHSRKEIRMAQVTKDERAKLYQAGKCQRCKQKVGKAKLLTVDYADAERSAVVVEKATADSRSAFCEGCAEDRRKVKQRFVGQPKASAVNGKPKASRKAKAAKAKAAPKGRAAPKAKKAA